MSAEVGLYVDGVGYAAAMLESEVGRAVDEAGCFTFLPYKNAVFVIARL